MFTKHASLKFLFILFLFTLLLAACQKPESIRIGFSVSLTGRGASLGKDVYEGTLLAIQEINQEGGPFQFDLIVRDDAGDPNRAMVFTQEFARMGIEVVMGYTSSALAQAVLPVLQENGMVLIGASISSPIFDKKDDPLFRVVNSSVSEARAVAEYIAKVYGSLDFIAVYDVGNAAYAEAWYKAFRQRYEAKGGRVADAIPLQTTPLALYRETINAALLKTPQAKGFCGVASSIDTAGLAQAFKQRIPDGLLAVSGWASSSDLISYGGKAVEGAIIAQSYNFMDESPGFLAFKERFQANFGRTPSFGTAHAYEAVQYLKAALTLRKKGEPLKEALKKVKEIQGVQRKIQFDETGDAHRPLFIQTIREAKFIVISEQEPEL
jgi:branched-chain amino acid transport system substrate-binding protein